MAPTDPAPAAARDALAGVRAVILDADGVLIFKGEPLPGAAAALRTLRDAGVPFRIVTNFSSAHRETLAVRFGRGGFPVDPGRIVTAASSAAAYTAARYPGEPLFVLAVPDARREFDGQRLLTAAEAADPGASAAAVVIGDAGHDLSFENLDAAYGLIRRGAAFLAMHRNPWWFTPKGPTLDAGAAVAGLEFALGRPALVLGKPSPEVFLQAAATMAQELGARLPRRAVLMVGDDPLADLRPARRLGMRTALVLTGKVAPDAVDRAVEQARFTPDVIAVDVAAVIDALIPGAPSAR
jgi:HAD superfamily hydrolase (TIGR01450 family)